MGPDAAQLRISVSATVIILALSFCAASIILSVEFAYAQTLFVTIKADGSISPSTAPMKRVGDLYVLTDDVGQISVQRSNMTLDGDGHRLQGTTWFIDSLGNNVTVDNSGGIFLTEVENVTVKNFVLNGCQIGVSLDRSSNVTVKDNVITGAKKPLPGEYRAGVFVWMGDSNAIVGNHFENNYEAIYLGCDIEHCIISENNITGNSIGIVFWNASNNIIYRNNFINNTINVYDDGANSSQTGAEWAPSLNAWDGGLSSGGNYWSDYLTRYPGATEIDSSGIGNMPYVVDANNTDRYPLMEPFNSTANSPVSSPSPSPSPSPSATSSSTEPFPTALVAIVSGVSAAAIGLGLIIYLRKRNH